MVKPRNRTCFIIVLKKGESTILWYLSSMLDITVGRHSPHWIHQGFAKWSILYIFDEVLYAGPHCGVLAGIVANNFSNVSVVKSEKGKKLKGTM